MLVPSTEEVECYWPVGAAPSAVTRLVQHQARPDPETWQTFSVRPLGNSTGVYDKARRMLQQAEASSDLQSDAEMPPKRVKRPPQRLMDSTSSDSETADEDMIPPSPPPNLRPSQSHPPAKKQKSHRSPDRTSTERRPSSTGSPSPELSQSILPATPVSRSTGPPTSRHSGIPISSDASTSRQSQPTRTPALSQSVLPPTPVSRSMGPPTSRNGGIPISSDASTSRQSQPRTPALSQSVLPPTPVSRSMGPSTSRHSGIPFSSDASTSRQSQPTRTPALSQSVLPATPVSRPTGPPTSRHSGTPISSDAGASSHSEPTTTPTAASQPHGGQRQMFTHLLKLIEDVKLTQKMHTKMLNTLLRKKEDVSLMELPEGANLPLQTEEELQSMNTKLCNSEFRAAVVAMVADVGGTTLDDAVRRMMSFLLSHQLSRQFNLFGRNGKKKFRDLALFDVFYAGLKNNNATQDVNLRTAELALGKWFTGARDRGGNRARRARDTAEDNVAVDTVVQ